VHGRLLLVQRVVHGGRPVAHVAKEMGVSQQCGHRWVARYRAEGEAGLQERSSRPHRCPGRTSAGVEDAVVALREHERRGQDWLGAELVFHRGPSAGSCAATSCRICVSSIRSAAS
jgi:transposase